MTIKLTIELNRVFEQYAFYRLADMDFDSAMRSLVLSKKYKSTEIRHVLLRDGIIAYMRPFSGSNGVYSKGYRLAKKDVPQKYIGLYNELDRFRNQLFAHTDVSARAPHFFTQSFIKGYPLMAFKGNGTDDLYAQIGDIVDLTSLTQKKLQAKLEKTLNVCRGFFSEGWSGDNHL